MTRVEARNHAPTTRNFFITGICLWGGFMDEQGFPTIFESMDERRIATAMHAQILHSHPDRRYARVSTDSRCVTGNEMFLALKGERFDAHDFLPQVFHAQCRGIVIDSAHAQTLTIPKEVTAFVVDDVLKAFGARKTRLLRSMPSRGPTEKRRQKNFWRPFWRPKITACSKRRAISTTTSDCP